MQSKIKAISLGFGVILKKYLIEEQNWGLHILLDKPGNVKRSGKNSKKERFNEDYWLFFYEALNSEENWGLHFARITPKMTLPPKCKSLLQGMCRVLLECNDGDSWQKY